MKDNLLIIKQLDKELLSVKALLVQSPPKNGWVRTLRKALGMTIKQLARRLGVDPSRVVKIETSEIEGGITVKSLQNVAAAFECIFVYRFVPQASFEEMIKQQSIKIASRQVQRSAETMDLEAQSVDKQWLQEQIRLAADELLRENWKHLWDKNV